jgi:hypothetical protein
MLFLIPLFIIAAIAMTGIMPGEANGCIQPNRS